MGIVTLDDLYYMVSHIYSDQNSHRHVSATFAHFVEVCGMLSIHDRRKKREEITVVSSLCKALGWFFPLMAKFRVASIEELIFRKFPYVCPYCRKCPHNDAECKSVRGTEKTVNHKALIKKYEENLARKPASLDEWQAMFQSIYPRSAEDRSARSTLGLLEELGELAEAIRVFERHPKYFAGEAADVFSYIMGIANEHGLRMEQEKDIKFSFEAEFFKRYPGMCLQCGYEICVCPAIPDSTVGRMAKELDLQVFSNVFLSHPDIYQGRGQIVASNILDHLGGYAGLLNDFPIDRGEANDALVVLCLKLSEAMSRDSADISKALQSVALKAASSTSKAGSRRRSEEVEKAVAELTKLWPSIKFRISEIPDKNLGPISSKIEQLLNKTVATEILLVLANPKGTTPLRLQEEERAVREALKLSLHRDAIIELRKRNATIKAKKKGVPIVLYNHAE